MFDNNNSEPSEHGEIKSNIPLQTDIHNFAVFEEKKVCILFMLIVDQYCQKWKN